MPTEFYSCNHFCLFALTSLVKSLAPRFVVTPFPIVSSGANFVRFVFFSIILFLVGTHPCSFT